MARETDKPGKLSRLELREPKRPSLSGRLHPERIVRPAVLGWIINVVAALVLVLILMGPKPDTHAVWREALLNPGDAAGQNLQNQIAVADFRVQDSFTVMDEPGTRALREQAAQQAKSVYDFDSKAGEKANQNIGAMFLALKLLEPQTASTPATGNTLAAGPSEEPISPTELLEKKTKLLAELDTELTIEEFDHLLNAKPPPDVDQVLSNTIGLVYRAETGADLYVVKTNELSKKDREKGIIAWGLDDDSAKGRFELPGQEAISDLDAAREKVAVLTAESLRELPPKARAALIKYAQETVQANLTFNKKKSEDEKSKAENEAKSLVHVFTKGEVIVRKGDRISDEARKKIMLVIQRNPTDSLPLKNVGLFLIIATTTAFLYSFANRNIKKFKLTPKDMAFLALCLVAWLGALKLIGHIGEGVGQEVPEGGLDLRYLVPLAGAAMLVRMVLNSEIAVIFSILIAAFGAMVADNNLFFGVYTLIGALVAASGVGQCRQRSSILRAGLILGLANALLIVIVAMIEFQFENQLQDLKTMLLNAALGAGGGLAASIVVTGLVPLNEVIFGYATDIKLLELLNQDHPLLKDLSMKTPGTHQHSLMVGNLAEAAAKAVGANPLLAKVCAMYHDIGKMEKPQYFVENQRAGENLHDRLAPSMSTLIIHHHVKEGVSLALKHKLPAVVVDAIQQHHGASLVSFFYEKAKEKNDTGVAIDEADYRYPGPKPQTREAAILLLADIIEAAARSVRDPDAARLQGLVQTLINRCFVDGQLDECDLTLKNLHDIARSFNHTLAAIYHYRPEYPTQPSFTTGPERKKRIEHDADRTKDHSQAKTPDPDKKDQDEVENYLKRLGM